MSICCVVSDGEDVDAPVAVVDDVVVVVCVQSVTVYDDWLLRTDRYKSS